jgi:hypothetical protein
MSVVSNNYQAPIFRLDNLENLKFYYKKPNLYNKTLEITKAYLKDPETNFPNETIYFQLSNLSLKNIDNEKNTLSFECNDKELYNFYCNLDKSNITTLYNKRTLWFDNEDDEVLEFEDIVSSYKKIYKDWDDESQTFRFKTFFIDNEVPIFNTFKEKLEFENLNENDELSVIIEYIGIRFDEDDFFPLFLVKQIKLKEQKTLNFEESQFLESDFDDEEDDEDEDKDDETENNEIIEDKENNIKENIDNNEEINDNEIIKEENVDNLENKQNVKKRIKAKINGIKLKEL